MFIYQKVTQKSLKERELLSSQEYEESTMPIGEWAVLKVWKLEPREQKSLLLNTKPARSLCLLLTGRQTARSYSDSLRRM